MKLIQFLFLFALKQILTSPVPINIDGHWLTTEDLDSKEHQIIFRRMGDYATDVIFHHIHIPVSLDTINKISEKAIFQIKKYAEYVFKESMMHYHGDNQNADNKKAEEHARLITDQNLFVVNESEKSINYFKDDLISLTSALPTSASKISKCQIELLFGFLGTAFVSINAIQIKKLPKQTSTNGNNIATLTHISEIQQNHLEHLDLENASENSIMLNALRYNPALLASAAHKVVLKSSDIIHKIAGSQLTS